mmetsp:Transcript_60370/g.130918  ORF Transcript_60370/g.130918 Transcript_60370/m.130918 type:complete len:134 (-) Transcript_60370:967-1368(-)
MQDNQPVPAKDRLCVDCQLNKIDPLHPPEKLLLGPFKVGGKKCFVIENQLKDRMKKDKTIRIHLRVFKVGTYKELNYPKYGMIKVNAKVLKTLNQPPENTSARKRKDHPLDITDNIKPSQNDVDMTINNDNEI